ncbi:hypothetical protein BD311DRAFT_780186 [Dichomitus squalens]|uniref:EF-hand domain-containing protein n=1 Tax=Dichomitus squalens TaxID=114155 RepID=A0A4V2JZM9_9APHY|nr:hypothetical protein BD311DRAFT_780186 [Dichomitus squalens]
MSLRSFAKRFHRSHSRQGKDPDSSVDQDGDESARTASATPESQASDPTASVTRPDPFPLPGPEATASMSMPVPESAPAPALGPPMHLHSMDGALAELTPMQGQLDSGPSMRKIDKALDTMGDRVTSLTSQADRAMTVMNNVTAIANAAVQGDMAQKIERGIQRFADDLPWLMKALDEVARIHPVVTVAVLAFKAVYALESTRQENDRRVVTLYVEMKDMMMVMVQFGIENRTHIGLDGRPLKDRLEELAEKTAKDIKDCANLCDTFVKKKLLVKVFKGPVWAEKLSGFVQVFSDRKADLQFALAMHTANSLTDVKRQNYEIQAKLDIVLGLFNKFISTDERRIALEIESKGGRAKVRQDDEALKSLIALEDTIRPQHLGGGEAPRDVVREKTTRNKIALAVDELKIELRQDVEDAVAKNFEAFTGKFELQVEVLQIALERYIRAENDRVIGAVTDAIKQGPHLKIKDLELRKIWQDMGWRGNVKARLFVLTLQDHYRDLFDNMAHAANPDAIANDEWALEYLGHSYLRPLMEAFDDDGSGYVSITEVNKLMDMRPSSLGWSIPHWLAYWAIGWQIASTWYINRIRTATSKMREALPSVLPLNRGDFDYHFTMHWPEAIAATVGFSECEDATLQDRFQEYIKSEEDRIRGNLEKIKYNIDSAETVLLVAGSGRIEKCFFPLVCLILEHDLRKVRMATRIVIVHTELMNMHITLWHVLRALDRRYNEVSGLFAQKRLDEVEQLKQFASGLFLYIRPHNDLWSLANLRDGCFYISHEHEDGEEPLDSEGVQEQEILPVVDTTMFDEVHDEVEDDRVAPDPVKTILGEWNGFAYTDSRYPTRPMISLRFHHSQKDGDNFICAYGVEFDGDLYNASGTCRQSDDGTIQIEWTIHYPDDLDIHYNGVLLDEFTISGTRIFGDDAESDWSFTLKRISAAHMTLRIARYGIMRSRQPCTMSDGGSGPGRTSLKEGTFGDATWRRLSAESDLFRIFLRRSTTPSSTGLEAYAHRRR